MNHGLDPIMITLLLSLVIGTFMMIVAQKIKVSAILLLLLGGIVAGPEVLGLIDPSQLGKGFLSTIISFCVAIILFEGGLTLDYSGYKKASKVIIGLLTLGVIITWALNTIAIYYLFDFPLLFSVFASSLIIVTGPTVILPLLRRINVSKNIANILHWEGVLIDPIGVFLAILSFEILTKSGASSTAFTVLIAQIGIGTSFGLLSGFISVNLLNKRWIPDNMINIFTLTVAIATLGFADYLVAESGLLAVIVAGLVVGLNRKKIIIQDIKKFKLEMTELSISLIFILLSANLNLNKLYLFGYKGIILLLIIVFVTRPIVIFVCSFRSGLSLKEKTFLSWISPRGIIAASVATVYSLNMRQDSQLYVYAWFVETFTFAVIIFTVTLQSFSAGKIVKWLNLRRNDVKEWIIIGAHDFSEVIAKYLISKKQEVTLIDNNKNRIEVYQQRGLKAIHIDALSINVLENEEFINATNIIALTDNSDLNALICRHWTSIINKNNIYRWESTNQTKKQKEKDNVLIGKSIWEYLPKPSIVSSEVVKQETTLFTKVSVEKENNLEILIAYNASNDRIHLLPNKKELQKLPTNSSIEYLCLKRSYQNWASFFVQDLVFIQENNTYSQLCQSFIDHLRKRFSTLNYNSILLEITQKQENSICIGNGVAILHVFSKLIEQPIISLGIISQSIKELKPYDNIPVKLFFLLVSPTSDSSKHLSIISYISKLVSNKEKREDLIKANDTLEVINIINK